MDDRQLESLRILRQPSRPYIGSFGVRRFFLVAIGTACASLPTIAAAASDAPTEDGHTPLNKAQCETAFEDAQRLRNSVQYLKATSEALRCANPECGAVLSDECGKLYSETSAATPSVVLGARTSDGSELGTVSIDVDGGARSVPLDGRPLLLDPGNHEFTFSADGFEPTKQAVVILAGERMRSIVGVLKREGGPAPSTTAEGPAPAKKAAPAETRHQVPLASYVLGGVGIAGFAGFVGFRVSGAHDYDALQRECKPTCSQSDVASARQKYVLSYVGLAVGGVASIAAVTVYFASPRTPVPEAAALQIRQQANGMTAHLTVPF